MSPGGQCEADVAACQGAVKPGSAAYATWAQLLSQQWLFVTKILPKLL